MNEAPDHQLLHRGPIAWMARNGVTANLLMLILLIGGAIAAWRLPQEVFPDFEEDAVTIRVAYPGASPEEVEQGVLLAIEEAVSRVENMEEIVSVAAEGSGTVTAEFRSGADAQKVYQEVVQEISRITTLPLDAEEPEIMAAKRRRSVMEIRIFGDADEFALRNIAESVRDRLLQDPGITQVDLEGVRRFEVHIQPSREALRTYGLSLRDIADTVARSSTEIPGGGVKTDGGEILVRFDERRDYAAQFRQLPVLATASGAVVTLGQIAEVREGFQDVDIAAYFNGKPAIGLDIYQAPGQRPVEVAKAARAAMERIAPSLPEGIEFAIRSDRSEIFKARLDLLTRNMGIGLCLVMLMLGLFLELRLAFWVTVGIPVSFLGAFLLLPFFGVSLNMISMFAFIIALGIVVDDAIVVGESIHSRREAGEHGIPASIRGARAVGIPVAFSILTNVVAFFPLLLVPGPMGKIWAVVPVVVSLVFLMSWIESVFVLPSHIAALSEHPKGRAIRFIHRQQQKISNLLQTAINRLYRPSLRIAVEHRYLVLAGALACLVFTLAYARSGRMGFSLMPKVEADDASATVTLPYGSPRAATEEARALLERSAREVVAAHGGDSLARGIFSTIENNVVQTRIYLTDSDSRPLSTSAVTNLWREATPRLAGAARVRFEADRGGPGGGPALTVELSHADIPSLERAAEALGERLRDFPDVADIDDGFNPGKQQLDFQLNAQGRSLGFTPAELARQVRNAFYGAEALRQQRGRNEVRVMVRLEDAQRASEHDIEQMMVRTPAGAEVPLRQVADFTRGRSYTTIARRDGRRTMKVTASVEPDSRTIQVLATLRDEILPQLVADTPGLSWSFQGRQEAERKTNTALIEGVIFSLLAIYALLAIPFRSYFQPLIVMLAIPFGAVGALLGHVLMGYTLSSISFMGMIALSGVVINDALVMVVFANQGRAAGLSAFAAMVEAGTRRFRPILLTTITTFGGLAPMIFETSRQARFMIPMAISLGYGLVFATAITLVLVPALYLVLDDLRRLREWVFGTKEQPSEDETLAGGPGAPS
jgi:multidrug efflux pump subunit AcrB